MNVDLVTVHQGRACYGKRDENELLRLTATATAVVLRPPALSTRNYCSRANGRWTRAIRLLYILYM